MNLAQLAGPLQGLGMGLMSAGSGGWQNFAPGFSQGLMQSQQMQSEMMDRQERKRLRDLQEQQLQMQMEQQRTANQDAVARKQAIEKLLGGGMMAPNGMSQAQFGGAPVQPGLMSSNFSPEQIQFLQALGPDAAPIIGEQLFKQNDPVKWDIEKVREGNKEVTYRINPYTGDREKLGEGAAFAPPASMFPAIPSGYQVTAAGLTPIPGGPADPAVKMAGTPPTESQQKAEQLSMRAEQQLPVVLENWDALSSTKDQALSMLPSSLASMATSAEYQRANNALADIASSYLYSVSGAQAPESEVQRLVETIKPKIGESEESKADKKARLTQMVQSISLKRKPGSAPLETTPQQDSGVVTDLPPGFE